MEQIRLDELNEEKVPVTEPERQEYYINLLKNYIDQCKKEGKTLTYCVQTFGCQMNAHDSERLEGILEKIGFVQAETEDADVVLYNTCTVRENANKKLFGHLGHLKNKKQKNKDMLIGICGCMMQQKENVDFIEKSYKYVDLVFGTFNTYKLAELIADRLMTGKQVIEVLPQPNKNVENLPQKRKYKFKSGVNIMYGCNNFCTYCIVPYVRGRERSRVPEEIMAEIKCLRDDGVKEIMLLGQNVNSYGTNYMGESEILKENPSYDFPDLLRDVCKIDGIERVRFMTSNPKDLSDKLIQVIKENKKICRHIHLPVQSGSSRLLKAMNRKYTKEHYLALVEKIRKELPDISLTTDIMVGFPGETEEDFLDTMDVVKKAEYDQAFTFIYSIRTGTPAATMEQVPEEVVKERFDRLLKLVQDIAAKRSSRFEGMVKDVLVEEKDEHEEGYLTGRMDNNITVHFKGDEELIGSIVNVKLTEAKGFYYIGELAE
ncbi:MAG: tRNA (N6-isopentenyl adenosine(37)-C2)-methylthiotransferase MiaB [Eubacterium sp.]|nr:tRNA (N6-isopentenyl adenosine(37)-C2)-methylthiotransferase MiaB [Eubacterium sp.]